MNAQKELLRRELLKQRQALTSEEAIAKSEAITQKLLQNVRWADIKTLHIYSSVTAWNEVDTTQTKKIIRERYKHITITSRPANKIELVPTELFDLIVVPVLGFDKDNYRIGLGGGWYDRFLAVQPRAKTIGLAYAAARLDSLPHELHDISLDKIITEL